MHCFAKSDHLQWVKYLMRTKSERNENFTGLFVCLSVCFSSLQEDIGVETDEDCGVKIPQ